MAFRCYLKKVRITLRSDTTEVIKPVTITRYESLLLTLLANSDLGYYFKWRETFLVTRKDNPS